MRKKTFLPLLIGVVLVISGIFITISSSKDDKKKDLPLDNDDKILCKVGDYKKINVFTDKINYQLEIPSCSHEIESHDTNKSFSFDNVIVNIKLIEKDKKVYMQEAIDEVKNQDNALIQNNLNKNSLMITKITGSTETKNKVYFIDGSYQNYILAIEIEFEKKYTVDPKYFDDIEQSIVTITPKVY